jgi:four helix bundle protein
MVRRCDDELFEYLIIMYIEELKNRYKLWAISVVLLTWKLSNEPELKAVRNQIVCSAPSTAVNYRAACRGKSGPDFINKLKIVEEELDETIFWLEFIVALLPEIRQEIVPFYKEADELLSITVSSIKTARKNK